jgi:DNA-binding beta-propeller fold protein YncE
MISVPSVKFGSVFESSFTRRQLLAIPAAISILFSTACNTVTEDLTSPLLSTNRTKTDSSPRLKPEVTWPGQQPDGAMLLPNMWSLKPAGKQVLLGDFPVNIAIHPSGRWAAILHSGNGQNEVIVVHLADGVIVSRIPIEESFYGIAFTSNGDGLFCSGAGDENIHQFSFKDGYVLDHRTIQLSDPKIRAVPSGIAISRNGKNIYVANVWGQKISFIQAGEQPVVSELALSTNLPRRVATPRAVSEDEAAITKRAEAVLDTTTANDPFPYTCVLDEKRNRLYVSYWAQAGVAVIDLVSREAVDFWHTDEHPNEMVLSRSGKLLFVANANRNTVSILDTDSGKLVEKLLAELKPNSPPGSTPNSLALSPDENLLFVANANINTVAVFDISEPGKSRSVGFIPVGWYPTSVRVTPDGKKLLVANGKGLSSKSNRYGPQPGHDAPAGVREYIGSLFHGSLSIIDLPSGQKFEEAMKRYTEEAYACMPRTNSLPPEALQNHPVPRNSGDISPIRYCIYIIKENRTYDQVLGDMPQGKGDPTLCLFDETVTPNHHELAREFVLLDNFYVESEVSADGHEWTMGAYATDFVEKNWPLSYGHNKHKKYSYPAEGNFAIAVPAGGYLWDRAKAAGVSYRSFGEFVVNGKTHADPSYTRVPALKGHFDPHFRGFDTDYPDVKRAERFISELRRFEQEGDMPRLIMLRLPNDHTSGTTKGKFTPIAQVADNDLALGRVIEAVSHSKFWPQTAIFIVEDDAQNGPDHIDAHRTIAFAISPYTKRRSVDSTMYTTSSMLHTMELILGLSPMSQFDAAAIPMFNSFQATPNLRPYKSRPSRVDINARNHASAWGSKESGKMDFSKEDAADDLRLNEIVWRSVKGADNPMPAPTRAAFVFAKKQKDEDDD